jgi:hypothetical protein
VHLECVSYMYFLKIYVLDDNHVVDWGVIQVEHETEFRVHLVCILDRKLKVLRN